MKKFLSVTLILAMALTLCFSFAACNNNNNEIKKFVDIDYANVFPDYLEYPSAANVASLSKVERNVADIYADESLSIGEKIAEMMYRSTQNEVECEYFSFFIAKLGETKLNSNHGKYVYQKVRRQSDTLKDDITYKYPANHNFDMISANILTDARIRYVKDGKYYEMENKGKKDIYYDTQTGLLTVSNWARKNKNWGKADNAMNSRSYGDARKTCVNWENKKIVDETKDPKIVEKTDNKGNVYYELTFSIDTNVANKDEQTVKWLEQDNGGDHMTYNYCDFVVQIWEIGLAKSYYVNESWNGHIVVYNGSAQCESNIVFSYSENDLKDTFTNGIYQKVKK